MHDEFKISMMGELNFFLGLQIKQMEDKIFFNQSKYVKEMLKKFGLEDSKLTKIHMSTEIKLTKDDEADSVDSSKYRGEITTKRNQMDYKRTKEYLPRVHRTRQIDEELRESYRNLEKCLLHEGKIVTPSFISENNMHAFFQAVGLEPFLTLNEPICPRFVAKVKRDEELRPYIMFKLENFFGSIDKRNKVKACTAYMLYYLTIRLKFNFTSMIIYRINEAINKCKCPIPFAMTLTCLHNHILTINPQAIVPIARFIFHEHVMDPLDISRNPSKEKGKKIASPSVISSSSSSFDDNEAPSFLEFYDELSDSEYLTKA
nr:retrovirus-related Pol polyprotein from transposon TNT 1-94 [Tanacetum cinerariifolium]